MSQFPKFNQDNYNLWRYNIDTSKLENLKIPIQYCGRILQMNRRIFMTGGQSKYNLTTEFIESNKSLNNLCNMINGRLRHCMLSLDDNRFCVIAGEYKSGSIKDCEEYNISENKWKLMPKVNDNLYEHSGIRTANQFIYIFGGDRNGSLCKAIEYIDLNILDKWNILELQTNESENNYYALLIELPTQEILIFQGVDKSKIYTFSPSKRTIRLNASFSIIGDCFFQASFIKDTIYSIGRAGHIHIYKPSTNSYRGIEYSTAIK